MYPIISIIQHHDMSSSRNNDFFPFFFFFKISSRISTAYNETHVVFEHRINDTVIRYIGRISAMHTRAGRAIRAGNENKFSLGIIGGS